MRATMRALRRLSVVGIALAVGGAAAAPTASAASGVPAPRPLVALGDSYSSGEANPPFDPAAPGCDRSPNAWPVLAAALLGRPAVNLACSGAQTKDVVNPYKGQPAQVDALKAVRPRPRIVTITIGGNDAGFSTVLGACVATDCVESGAVARGEVTILTVLPERLVRTYRAVRKAAPGAKLVVVGYPRLFPRRQADVTGCPWLTSAERRAPGSSGSRTAAPRAMAAPARNARRVLTAWVSLRRRR